MTHRFVSVPRDFWSHPVVEDVARALPPIPDWWNLFFWSPIPCRMAQMTRERKARKAAHVEAENRAFFATAPMALLCSVTLHRWAIGVPDPVFRVGACVHGFVFYHGCDEAVARRVVDDVGIERIRAGC